MIPTDKHLHRAHELLKEEAKISRLEWEQALETSKDAQRAEGAARDKFLAFQAAATVVGAAKPATQQHPGAQGPQHT